MNKPLNHVGIDLASTSLSISIYRESSGPSKSEDFLNNLEGFDKVLEHFKTEKIVPSNSVICMEATGVYGEELCYYFHKLNYSLVVEAPQKTKRAFHSEDKDDHIDAQQLGEYAYRFYDQLTFWSPPLERVEKVNTLLIAREQMVKQRTMNQNLLKVLRRKTIQTPLADDLLTQLAGELTDCIKTIENEIKHLFQQDLPLAQHLEHTKKMKGVNLLMIANLFVYTEGFSQSLNSKKIAARLGIAPRRKQSGTCLKRVPKSRGDGPLRLRKILYLASMTARTHDPKFKKYFLKKVQQGKKPMLVLNNIQNKLLGIICTLINTNASYEEHHQSINPDLLKNVA